MKYGIFDTQDKCWIGDDRGPKQYDEEIIARVAAQVYDTMMRNAPGRTRAKEYDGSANKLKDEVKPAMTPVQALDRLERGGF